MSDFDQPIFAVLGPLLIRGARPLTGKQRAVLGILLLDPNTVISRDRLVDGLWDVPPPSALANVHTYVWGLRRALGETLRIGGARLETQRHGYLLRVDRDQLDSLVFADTVARARRAEPNGDLASVSREFERALRLWRGHPFEDVSFSEAVTPRLVDLEERLLQVRSDWTDVRLSLGHYDDVIRETRTSIDAQPLREHAWAQFILALYHAGRRGEALEAYRRARQVLLDELGIEPGHDLRRLHEEVLNEDPAPRRPRTIVGASASATRSRPVCQLPSGVAGFVGRKNEAAALSRLVRRHSAGTGAPAVAAVHGVPGVGKSAFAIHLAHLWRSDFPDGQLFVRLGGSSGRPRQPAEVLCELLRTLGVDRSVVPETLEERAALYRSCLADSGFLVVLDDAAGEEQLRPLLPGTPGNAVLVTSRRPLAGLAGERLIGLEVPDESEALEILGRIAGPDRVEAEAEAARSIIRYCGRLPLALRVIGARLAVRPAWSLHACAARLRDPRRRLDELTLGHLAVRRNVTVGYGRLPADARRAFRLFGLAGVDGPAVWSVSALTGDGWRADRVLEALVMAGLLTATSIDEAGRMRYRMHELVRLFARERAEAEETQEWRDHANGNLALMSGEECSDDAFTEYRMLSADRPSADPRR